MDRGIVEPHGAERLGLCCSYPRGVEGQHPCVVAEGVRPRIEIARLPVVMLGVVGQCFWGALGTEVVCV